MAFPPAAIAADKAPGPPSSDTEHPDHHNALANAVNDITTELTSGTIGSHIGDAADAHDASAISIVDVATIYTATDVEAALAEVKVIADAAVTPAEAAASYQPLASVLTNTTASFTTADETKLDGIEAAADVTDATNVAAAGAVMESDTSTALMSFVIDEDAMTSNSATKVPTQQSVKAYADTFLPKVAGGASVENIGAVEENVNTVATSGATETLDVSVYGVHDVTMDQSCTFTFSNPAPSGKCSSFLLILRGAFTPTFPASVDWSGGAPTYATPSVFVFVTVDAGTTWLGTMTGSAFA